MGVLSIVSTLFSVGTTVKEHHDTKKEKKKMREDEQERIIQAKKEARKENDARRRRMSLYGSGASPAFTADEPNVKKKSLLGG